MRSSACAVLCFVFFAFQGLSGITAEDCKDVLGGSVQVRLNESIAKVTALNSCLDNSSTEIVNIKLSVNSSTQCVNQLISNQLQQIINARIYLTYAVNLALQANKSVCITGWQNEYQTIYDAANARLTSASQTYLSAADSLAEIEAQLSVNPYSQVLVDLNLCAALNTLRIDKVDTCLGEAVYTYSQYVYASEIKIATAKYQADLLKRGVNYGSLAASVNAIVSIALNSIKGFAEYILTCAGVSAEALYNTAVTEIVAINVRYKLDVSAVDLNSDIINYINYLNQLEVSVTAAVHSNATVTTLANLIASLEATAGVVVILSPQLVINSSAYLQYAQGLLTSASSQLEANYSSFVNLIHSTIGSLLNLYDNYNVLIATAQANLTACLPTCIDARINNIEQTSACLHTVVANFEASSNVTNSLFSAIVSQINAYNSNSPFDVEIQFGYIKDWAIATSVQLLSPLNLHVGNNISLEICGYLNTTFTNAVSNYFNTIVQQAGTVTNLTSYYESTLQAAVTATLQPIEEAVALIHKVKPYYNVSGILDAYNNLYSTLVTVITNYLTSIATNVTTLSNINVRFNLANNFTKLCQDLSDCIQTFTTELTVNNFVPPFNCFIPILSNFSLLLNTTIASVQATVHDVSLQANTTETLIIEFIGTTLTSGSENATIIAQTSLANASITTEAQVNATSVNITLAKQVQIDGIISQIQSAITSLLNGNLVCLSNVTAAAKQAVEPWELAFNFSIINYPNHTQEINAEIPRIQSLVNTTLLNISTAVAPYLNTSTQQGLLIQTQLQTLTDQLNLNLLNYSAANLTIRCGEFTSQPYNLSTCLTNAYNELNTYLTTVVQSQFNAILQTAPDTLTSICANIYSSINVILNETRTIAVNEGALMITKYNVTTSQIITKTMGALSSFNITPILTYTKSIHGFSNAILSRQNENRNAGNYTISTTTYVIYDAVGSVMYLTYWYSSFPNETALANQVVNTARQEVLALFPDATSIADYIRNISLQINTTLNYQINLLAQPSLDISCGQYYNTEDYYDLYVCIKQLLNVFEVYYNQTLKDCAYQNDWSYRTLQNLTAKFNDWRLNIVIPKAAVVIESLKPIAEKLITDNNCTVPKLIGYALHIITDRYNEYKPQIVSTAVQINATAANVTARNYTGIYTLEPTITNNTQPLYTIINLIQNSGNTTLLTPQVLAAPQTFYNETTVKFDLYLANFSLQAVAAVNALFVLLQNVEIGYAGLNYDYFYNFCYNPANPYPLIDLVSCYNQHHYGFLVYLSNILRTAQSYLSQLVNLNNNYVSLITNYGSNTLLPSHKNQVGLYAAQLYVAANITLPADLQALLTITKDCVVGMFTPVFKCFIYK